MKYSNSFFYDLSVGEDGEDWVNQIFNGKQFVEVKTDAMMGKTKNVFIEYKFKSKPSGIATTKATYWIYKMYEEDCAIIISVEKLKALCRDFYKQKKYMRLGGDNNMAEGFLIPITELFAIANLKLSQSS
jgi:hypothetical protein